jgi:DNA-binding Lrp family transcriptional regulator
MNVNEVSIYEDWESQSMRSEFERKVPVAQEVELKDGDPRDLLLLNAISEGTHVTQRDLSRRLGVALGLTNLYLKRLASRGLIKIISIRPNRLQYLLTPKGIAEKSRLTYSYVSYSLRMYREARESLRMALEDLALDGHKRIAFFGVGEAAEVAYLCLKENGLELSAVFDHSGGQQFLGFPVRGVEELNPDDFDRIVITAWGSLLGTEARVNELLRLGVPQEKVVTLRRLPGMSTGPPVSGDTRIVGAGGRETEVKDLPSSIASGSR